MFWSRRSFNHMMQQYFAVKRLFSSLFLCSLFNHLLWNIWRHNFSHSCFWQSVSKAWNVLLQCGQSVDHYHLPGTMAFLSSLQCAHWKNTFMWCIFSPQNRIPTELSAALWQFVTSMWCVAGVWFCGVCSYVMYLPQAVLTSWCADTRRWAEPCSVCCS